MSLPGRGTRVVPKTTLPDLSLVANEMTPGVYNVLRAIYGVLKASGAHLQGVADANVVGVNQAFIGDTDYGILPTDDIVYLVANLTTLRTWRLPAARSVPAGKIVWIVDRIGGISNSGGAPISWLNITTSVGDLGGANPTLEGRYDAVGFISDGFSSWQTLNRAVYNIPGYLYFGEYFLTSLVNGPNQNILVDGPSNTHTAVVITSGPTLAFSIGGIQNGLSGRILFISNDTGQTLTFNHKDGGSFFGNQIRTATGGGIALPTETSAMLIYDANMLYWNLIVPTV